MRLILRKHRRIFEDIDCSGDYKLESSADEMRLNFESTDKWLYLGGDARDSSYVKVGLTMGDLSTRSYSSARPDYYMFCAFKCMHDIRSTDLKRIEVDLLAKMESRYRYDDWSSKRRRHFESGVLSECFYDICFDDFFRDFHYEVYVGYREWFVITGLDEGFGGDEGEFVECLFNDKVSHHSRYRRMIVQYPQ